MGLQDDGGAVPPARAALSLVVAVLLLALALVPLAAGGAAGSVLLTAALALAVGAALPLLVRDLTRVPPLLFGLVLLGGAVVALGLGRRDLVLTVFGALLAGRLLGSLLRVRQDLADG